MTRPRWARLMILAGTLLAVAMLFESLVREILKRLAETGAGIP